MAEGCEERVAEMKMWVMTHPHLVCELVAYSIRQVGDAHAKSALTQQAVDEVEAMALQLAQAVDALTHALYMEWSGVDLRQSVGAGRPMDPRMN